MISAFGTPFLLHNGRSDEVSDLYWQGVLEQRNINATS